MDSFYTPAEIAELWVQSGVKKAQLPPYKMLVLGLLAGMFIGFGAHAFLLATTAGGDAFSVMLEKLIGAALFPVGLMLVILCGAELFTGNNLMTLALMDRKITWGKMLLNWTVVYLANLLGALLLAWLLSVSGLYTEAVAAHATDIAVAKTSMSFTQAFIKGIFCNILVVLACWLQSGAKNIVGKILGIWFPIMLFVFAGFEHSVANMTYIPLGIFLGADVSFGAFLFKNLLPVTLGNIVGGAVFIPVAYYLSYRKPAKPAVTATLKTKEGTL